ncbi:hypothetical protein AVEN_250040-1 [Araneus ventricosus]|uniref:Tesmin/TSO1-like CXC domain-containing protein n=1 Tax=Araneus ventricosus TaxID=182803 RepID=A0A4Y2QAT1_ARAVE|nr:hypothetical protein AVEN_250040-1 [Araneus ventricosus]
MSPLKKSDAELQKYFQFELAPFPLSLFDEGGLRKTRNPLDCDWKETKHGLFSVINHKEPDPPALLSVTSCKCAKGCNLTCTCRKSDIKCSKICYHCKGKGCTNSPEDDNVIANSANQEATIDIRMEEIISDVDLEEECRGK